MSKYYITFKSTYDLKSDYLVYCRETKQENRIRINEETHLPEMTGGYSPSTEEVEAVQQFRASRS